ncbi:MAG: Gfo/Idh/MocA family oxidoreductase, partial [Bryobacterales bacterium]|nr:Gfo/Idh/MocA family oxidoreductase [Bryobacterales bacterium]
MTQATASSNSPHFSRRRFGKAAIAASALSYGRILGANDRVAMGYIGLGNRGDQVHDAFLEHGDNATVAICDLRDDYMDLAAKKSASRGAAKRYHDYRKLLEDKNVDAVAICTPDQWHAVMFVAACKAGKDIYCEKPFSLTIFEGRRMVEAAAKYKPVTQVGLHRRSAPEIRKLAE